MAKKFREANPKVTAAIYAALSDAEDFINKNAGQAAEIYIKFLLEDEQQAVAAKTGFRPGSPGVKVTGEKFNDRFGVDPSKPAARQVRAAPEAEVVQDQNVVVDDA